MHKQQTNSHKLGMQNYSNRSKGATTSSVQVDVVAGKECPLFEVDDTHTSRSLFVTNTSLQKLQ